MNAGDKRGLFGLGLLGALGLIYWLWPKRTGAEFSGPNMLKLIASESRSPQEFARRAEAWASAEAKPPSVAKIAAAYRRAKPGALAKLIREAREQRLAQTKARWKGLIARHEETVET